MWSRCSTHPAKIWTITRKSSPMLVSITLDQHINSLNDCLHFSSSHCCRFFLYYDLLSTGNFMALKCIYLHQAKRTFYLVSYSHNKKVNFLPLRSLFRLSMSLAIYNNFSNTAWITFIYFWSSFLQTDFFPDKFLLDLWVILGVPEWEWCLGFGYVSFVTFLSSSRQEEKSYKKVSVE